MPFQLYGMPVEIYDGFMEYPFAVPTEKIAFASDWNYLDAIDRKKHDSTTHVATPPRIRTAFKVNEWPVSKRFFSDAARIWFAAQHFDHRTMCSANLESPLPPWGKTAQHTEHQKFSLTPATRMLAAELGLILTYATRVDVHWAMIPLLLQYQALETVRIELQPNDFDLDPRCGWKDLLCHPLRDVSNGYRPAAASDSESRYGWKDILTGLNCRAFVGVRN